MNKLLDFGTAQNVFYFYIGIRTAFQPCEASRSDMNSMFSGSQRSAKADMALSSTNVTSVSLQLNSRTILLSTNGGVIWSIYDRREDCRNCLDPVPPYSFRTPRTCCG